MKKNLFLIIFFLCLFSKSNFSWGSPDDSCFLQLLWKEPLQKNHLENSFYIVKPIIRSKKIVFSYTNFSQSFVQAHSRKTGIIKWQWNDFIKNTPAIKLENNKSFSLVSENFRAYLLNTKSSKTIWKYETPLGYLFTSISLKKNNIYACWKEEKKESNFGWILTSKLSNPNKWDTIFKLSKDSTGFSPNLVTNFQICKTKKTQELLIFQNRSFNFETLKGRIDLYALDLKSKEIVWKKHDVDLDGNSNINAINIYNEKIYFIGNTSLQVYNLEDGEKIWKYKVERNPNFNFLVGNANILIENEKVFLKGNGDLLVCLDAKNGEILWENVESGANPNQMVLFKNKIYYVADDNKDTKTTLHIIDSQSGKLLHRFISPNESKGKGSFKGTGGLVIKNDIMYIGDSAYSMCFKIL